MDNGEDWQKPNTFGEAALRSLEALLDQLGFAGLARTDPHRQAARLRRRRRHRRVRRDHARARPTRRRGRARALRTHPRTPLRHGRCDQRGSGRRRSRDRAPLRLPHDLEFRTPLRVSRGLPRPHPRVGRHAAGSAARRRRAGGEVHRREPAPPEPHARRAQGIRGGVRRCAPRAGRVPRRIARVPARQDRREPRQAAPRCRSLRYRGGLPQGALASRRTGARCGTRPVPSARPHRRCGELVSRRGLPRRGGRAR